MPITRRTVLTWGLGGAGLVALSATGLGLRSGTLRAPPGPLKVLDDKAYSVLAAVADRICPGSSEAPSASEVGVATKVDALLASLHPGKAKEIVLLLKVFDNALASAVLEARVTPFTSLSDAEQDAVLKAWSESSFWPQRLVYKAIRGLIASAYFSSPETYASVGYGGPPDFRQFRTSDGYADPASEPTGSESPPTASAEPEPEPEPKPAPEVVP